MTDVPVQRNNIRKTKHVEIEEYQGLKEEKYMM